MVIKKYGHTFDSEWPICYNCKHVNWLIGVGMGLRCSNKQRRDEQGELTWEDHSKIPPIVPSMVHTCDWSSRRPGDKSKLTKQSGDPNEFRA